jgi:hypothetical protein
MKAVYDTRKAAAWASANRHMFASAVDIPWIAETSEHVVQQQVNSLFQSETAYEDVRDWTVMNFNNKEDINIFLNARNAEGWLVYVCLNGMDNIADNVNLRC